MNVFFTTNVDKSLVKIYKWIPISYFVFVSTLLCVIFVDIPGMDSPEKISLVILVIIVFSSSVLMFCVQALARIENKLIELERSK